MVSKLNIGSSKFFQTMFHDSQRPYPREIKIWIVESFKIGINNPEIIHCADTQTFTADIEVSFDVDRCEENKCVR